MGPPVFCLVAAAHAHTVDDFIFLKVGVKIAQTDAEVESQSFAEPQLVAGGESAANQVALTARFGELIVELARLEHSAQIPCLAAAYIIAHLGHNLPQSVAAVFVVPAP